MIRVFDDPDVVHVDGKVSPGDDIETINTELILADLQTHREGAAAPAEGSPHRQGPRAQIVAAVEAGQGGARRRHDRLRGRPGLASRCASCSC